MLWHRPTFYRYECSHRAPYGFMLNVYGRRVIGASVRVGRFAYCVKWASVGIRR